MTLITAMVTPFKEGALDLEGLCENIEYQIKAGVQGLLFLGTTGEAHALSLQERNELLKRAITSVAGRAQVMVGTGTNNTQTTIARTKEAQDLGADCVLVVTPSYVCPSHGGILAHYEALCQKTTLPICLYNHPKRTGTALRVETIIALMQDPQIDAIKEASGSTTQMTELIARGIKVYGGDDGQVLSAMALGACGLISVTSNLLAEKMGRIVSQCNHQEFYEIYDLIKAIFMEPNPIGIKAAMELAGMKAGPCRLPMGRSNNLEMIRDGLQKQILCTA